jgi:hypothetical protein
LTEVQVDPAVLAQVGGAFNRGGDQSATNAVVKVYTADDVMRNINGVISQTLLAAGYTRATPQFAGGGPGRGGAGNGTPPANFTPPAGFTPPADFTPGAGRGGPGGAGVGGFGGLYTKQGAADLIVTTVVIPADVTAFNNIRFFSALPADVAQKLFDQIKGKKTLVIITAGNGLTQGFANRTPGAGRGAGGANGRPTATPTTGS